MTSRTALPGLALPPQPPADRKPVVHLCEHPGCTAWGSFGFGPHAGSKRWFCAEHRMDGRVSGAKR